MLNYQRCPGGDDDDDDPQDEDGSDTDDKSRGGARDRIYEKCMCGAAKSTGMFPPFSTVVGQSLIVIIIFLRCRHGVQVSDRGG